MKGTPMHTAIFYAAIPEDWANSGRERQFSSDAYALSQKISAPQLGSYVWQVSFQTRPGELAQLIALCEQRAVPYRILPLAEEPKWVRWNPPEDPYALKR